MIVKVYSIHCDLLRAKHPHDHHGVSSCEGWIEGGIDLSEIRRKASDGGWLITARTDFCGPKHYCPAARKVIESREKVAR